jgi:asparagine synthase (glutamine-hydrolysing)
LVAAVGPELTIDPGALVASTMFYFLPEEQSALKGVFKLPPGSWAEWRADGTKRAGRYWEPAEEALAAASGPPADLAAVLEESVAAHLVADVPVASFLSGGLDSSLITAMAASRNPSIEAYTITFRPEDQRLEAMPDDAVYARKMAAHLGIRLHEIEISPDVVDMLPRVVDVLDEPIGDPAAINTVLMCQAARDAGVKVLLSGMGADELFGGLQASGLCSGGEIWGRSRRLFARAWLRRAWGGFPWRQGVAGFATAGGPSGSSPSPSCPRRRRSVAAIPFTTLMSSKPCSIPICPRTCRQSWTPITASTPTVVWPTTSTGCA